MFYQKTFSHPYSHNIFPAIFSKTVLPLPAAPVIKIFPCGIILTRSKISCSSFLLIISMYTPLSNYHLCNHPLLCFTYLPFPLPPDNEVQELIRVHQHGHSILSRILQLHPSLFCTKDHIRAIASLQNYLLRRSRQNLHRILHFTDTFYLVLRQQQLYLCYVSLFLQWCLPVGAIQIIPPIYKANLLLHILHHFLYSGYFIDRAALYYFFYDPAILLPGNFYCQLLPGSVTILPRAISNSISIIEAHFTFLRSSY